MRYPSWVISRKLPMTDSAMASRSLGRVPSRNLKIAPVYWRRSAWNRLCITWRCMRPTDARWGSSAARGAAGNAGAGRAAVGPLQERFQRLRVVLAGVAREDMDRPAAGSGVLQSPQRPLDRPGAGPLVPTRRKFHRLEAGYPALLRCQDVSGYVTACVLFRPLFSGTD